MVIRLAAIITMKLTFACQSSTKLIHFHCKKIFFIKLYKSTKILEFLNHNKALFLSAFKAKTAMYEIKFIHYNHFDYNTQFARWKIRVQHNKISNLLQFACTFKKKSIDLVSSFIYQEVYKLNVWDFLFVILILIFKAFQVRSHNTGKYSEWVY